MTDHITKEQFVSRYISYMTGAAWFTHFDDGMPVETYAAEAAEAAWDEPHQRDDGPEECARAEMSYWGED